MEAPENEGQEQQADGGEEGGHRNIELAKRHAQCFVGVILVSFQPVLFCHFLHFVSGLGVMGGVGVEVEVVERRAEVSEAFLDVGHAEEHGRRPVALCMERFVDVESLRVLPCVEEAVRLRQASAAHRRAQGTLLSLTHGVESGDEGEDQKQENAGVPLHIFLILLPLRAQLRKTTFQRQKELGWRAEIEGKSGGDVVNVGPPTLKLRRIIDSVAPAFAVTFAKASATEESCGGQAVGWNMREGIGKL